MASRTPRVYPRSRVSSMQGPRTNKPRLVVRARRRRTSPAQRIQSDLERAGRFLMEHSVKARAAASVAAAVVATVLGLVAAAPHAANRDNPDLVLATIILSLVLPALAVGAVWWWNDGVLSTNRVPFLCACMLALVVAQVVGQLTVDAAYARSVAVSRKLSDGFELRAGSKTSLRITVGVDVHVNHLVQLRVPSSTAESGEKLVCVVPVGYLPRLDRTRRGPVSMWTLCTLDDPLNRSCVDLMEARWPNRRRKVYPSYEDPYWAQLHTPECFLRVLGDATALATKSEVIVSRAPLANASVMEGYIASALDKLNTTYLSASPAVLHDRGQTGVADSRFPLVVLRPDVGVTAAWHGAWLMVTALVLYLAVSTVWALQAPFAPEPPDWSPHPMYQATKSMLE